MNLSSRVCLWVLVFLVVTTPCAAQGATADATSSPPSAHISSLEGDVTIDRDGQREPATSGLPLLIGDRVRSEAGRLEILFTDGTALHLDQYTTADLLAPDLIRLIEGQAYLIVAGTRNASRASRYQLDTPGASVQTNSPGQFRISAANGEVELAVVTGSATLATEIEAVAVGAGERVSARLGEAPSQPRYFNSANWDAFDRWSAARREARLGTISVRYLPADLASYGGVFDQYGTWRDEPDVGYVWYPSVEADWRPYYNGYWRPYPSWGSVWVGFDTWGYPTHHYGRWGFSAGFGWYWIPQAMWGPAWVSWGTSPGYVSWCPLGYYGYPVFSHWGLHGPHHGHPGDPWRGWTVVPHNRFGHPHPVPHVAVNGRHLGLSARNGFVSHKALPSRGYAVPRAAWGAGGAVARNQPRATAPGIAPRPGSLTARSGSVPRYGRGDGTGVTRAPGHAATLLDAARSGRRALPGSPADHSTAAPRASGRAFTEPGVTAGSRAGSDPGAAFRSRSGPNGSVRSQPSEVFRSQPSQVFRSQPSEVFRSRPSQAFGSQPNPSDAFRSRPSPVEVFRSRPGPRDGPTRQSPRDDAGSWNGIPRRETPLVRDPQSRETPRAREPQPRDRGGWNGPSGGAWSGPSGRTGPGASPRGPAESGRASSGGGPRSGGASGAAPRYNPGAGGSRGGGPSGAPSRRRNAP